MEAIEESAGMKGTPIPFREELKKLTGGDAAGKATDLLKELLGRKR